MQVGKTSHGDILFTPFKKITENSLLIKLQDDKIGVMYKTENEDEWNLMCNFGSFNQKCENDVMQVIIPNTGYSTNVKKEKRLFAKTFSYILINDPISPKNKLEEVLIEKYIEIFQKIIHVMDPREDDTLFRHLTLKNSKIYRNQNISFFYNNRIKSITDVLDNFPSINYLEQQYLYVQFLTRRYQRVLNLYSHNGDKILNMYIRSNRQVTQEIQDYYEAHKETFEEYEKFIASDSLEKMLITFYDDMQFIFNNAPIVDKDFIVYRGARTCDHFNGARNNIYVDRGFCSTSLDIDIARTFSVDQYLTKILIPKGSKCIYNMYSEYNEEYEIILNDQTYFLVTKEFQIQKYSTLATKIIYQDLQTNECIILND